MQNTERVILREFELLNCSTEPDFFGGPDKVGREGEHIVKLFKSRLKVEIVRKENFDLEFDLVGVDPSLANAIRRILLSDVPSMAFEKIHIFNNTSVIQDEVLAHRLGLIPLRANPKLFFWKAKKEDITDADQQVLDDQGNVKDTLEFELKIRCKRNPNPPENSKDPDELYIDNNCYTKHIKWIPKPGQKELFKDGKGPGPVDDDILIAKLRPGHEIDLKLYAVKGDGRDHAKFSPVSTAFYRLLPEIVLKKTVFGEKAERLQKCFSPGVIALEDCTVDDPASKRKLKTKKAVVQNSRYDASSRNVYRYSDLKDDVEMRKVKDHFIFTVESVGAVQPEELVMDAIKILAEKCDHYIQELEDVDNE